jgi:hypothetical protein
MNSNYLCISIDGLQSGMVGAYGNTWIHTSTLDTLACRSALFDRFYASTMDLPTALAEWWQSLPECDCHKILLTDDSDVFLHEHAGLFDEKHRLEAKQRHHPAGKLEETQFFRNMATIADLLRTRTKIRHPCEGRGLDVDVHDKRLDSCLRRNDDVEPFFLWAHFEGFRGLWDFPLSYRQQYQIDEDPDPYADVALPEIVGNNLDPDVVQSIREAYSGGVTLLDETLLGLLTFLEKSGLDKNTVLLFTSVRGFSLGEHSRIGANEDLYGENVHLPLFIRFPDGSFAGFRSQTLLQPADIFNLLTKDDLPEEPGAVRSFLGIDGKVIVTPDWFVYRKPSGDELYVKPDDRWEVNDVADRCPHVLEQIGDDFAYSAHFMQSAKSV